MGESLHCGACGNDISKWYEHLNKLNRELSARLQEAEAVIRECKKPLSVIAECSGQVFVRNDVIRELKMCEDYLKKHGGTG